MDQRLEGLADMFKHILAPLDGSSLAECVLPHLLAMARVYDAKTTLMRVLRGENGPESVPLVNPLDWELRRAEADSYLATVAARLTEADPDGGRWYAVVEEGPPADRIIEYASENEVDLIMLSSHGRSGLSRWNVNSVVRKILQRANRSAFVARAYRPAGIGLSPAQYRRLFVPLDGSRRAECVLSTVETLARFHEADVIIGHVVARPALPMQVPPTDEDRELVERYVRRSREMGRYYLGQLEARLAITFTDRVLVDDDIADSLHGAVESSECDLVVLSAHGQSGKTRWPFGSIATSFIEYGSTPLLIVQDMPPEAVQPTRAAEAAEERKGH